MKDYNDIIRLRTKVLIIKDELSKVSYELKNIFEKYNNLDYLDEVNELNFQIEMLQTDVEDSDDYYEEDITEGVHKLLEQKGQFVESFSMLEKLHNDFSEITEISNQLMNQKYEKDMLLRSVDQDVLQLFI